jgi:hypothetical protein
VARAQAREISRLTWGSATIPQNAIPVTIKGKPYVIEFDEYTGETMLGNPNTRRRSQRSRTRRCRATLPCRRRRSTPRDTRSGTRT